MEIDGKRGTEFDHLTLLVELEERLLADVGFGDSFLQPLRLDANEVVMHGGTFYRAYGLGVKAG